MKINDNRSEFAAFRSAQAYLCASVDNQEAGSACGSACGAGDEGAAPTTQPSACGSACGAGDQ